jgi:hypothetical protein
MEILDRYLQGIYDNSMLFVSVKKHLQTFANHPLINIIHLMDGLKVGEIKSPHAGHISGLMCNTQMKNRKIKEETNRKTDRNRQYVTKRRNVHKNERIKELQ